MISTYPNPWEFNNTDKELISPDNLFRVVYYDLNEIAMGAPIGGACFLENTDGKKVQVNKWSGGPPIWETEGKLIGIPIWSRKFLKGTIQQIGVIDIRSMELKIFAKTFSVLHLHSFDKKIIYGIDSPIYKPTNLAFDIEKEKIETLIRLIG